MMRVLTLALALALVVATTRAAYAGDDAGSDAGDGGAACVSVASEDACVAVVGCAWADPDGGSGCFSVGGPVDARPGTGDPGGGGLGVTGSESADGCTFAQRGVANADSARWLFLLAAWGLARLGRRRIRDS